VGNGDGFVVVADGSRRWGRYGAAGVLARHTHDDGTVRYFLARRSLHCHQGGTWAIPGGAIDSHESPTEAALREFGEEIGVALPHHVVAEVHEDDHGGWSYWTLVVDVDDRFDPPTTLHWETDAVAWVEATAVADLDLHPAFRSTLLRLRALPT
jgi:8-oxo-dGTP diphosphatase